MSLRDGCLVNNKFILILLSLLSLLLILEKQILKAFSRLIKLKSNGSLKIIVLFLNILVLLLFLFL